MAGIPTTELLTGLRIALLAVAYWGGGFVVAYLLYRRWRGDGPRDDDGDDERNDETAE
ncbi:hypothetical protein SAMN04488066_11628 [Halorubrum aquaticum]|uniref:Uncharacterized protein n=1 Tax=Halorubrum aquaticum TaxID=387340 RepID=A0A1I3BX41_9EURY|nr:hypothetical protein [Halorubrum aquaticum]SFH66822.1 hypothetical protein SAMN04488066_11628 [Halorubrum aquaticum]